MARTVQPDVATRRGWLPGWAMLGVLCIGMSLVLGWSQGARASYWKDIPERDFQYLPEYCKLAVRRHEGQGYGVATLEQLAPLFAFEERAGCAKAFHHYCAALWHLHTTALPNPWLPRDHLLNEAVGDFQYMINDCNAHHSNAPILPEILTNQGRAFVGLKKYSDAVRVFTEAIQRNPKYVAAYAELSGVFLVLNNTEDARKILEDGLKQSPDSKFLKLRLDRLGSKEQKASEQPSEQPPLEQKQQNAQQPKAKQQKVKPQQPPTP